MVLALLPAMLLAGVGSNYQSTTPISLHIDATEINRCLIRVAERIPAKGGKFAVHYPTWLPGNHRPSGPINDVVRFHAYSNGQEISWTRNPVDMFEIDLHNPEGTKSVELDFTVAAPPGSSEGPMLARLKWNRVIFLPDGRIDSIPVTATVVPPSGWTIYSALQPKNVTPEKTVYNTVNAEELVDSPAELGKNARTWDLGGNHHFDVLTQSADALDLNPAIIVDAKNLVAETGALFHGSRHYRDYHFLMTFAPEGGEGLEHHESSEDGSGEGMLRGSFGVAGIGGLISHEMFHSWNGKHRRPAGLITPDFTVPEKTDLLWVYEGMTQYYGLVLACRSGFTTPEQTRDDMANEIGSNATKPGHLWRPLADTADAASILRGGGAWGQDRRQQDYYAEGVGLWLDADCTIRTLTNNKKSLDDFVLAFEGGPGGQPTTIPYTLKEVEAKLDAVVHYDWHGFFQTKVYEVRDDLARSVSKSGWDLIIDSKPAPAGSVGAGRFGNLLYSIGMQISGTGNVLELDLDSPGDKAGLMPTDTITTVNGQPFSISGFTDAITAAMKDPKPIALTYTRDGIKFTTQLDYHDGLKRARLEKVAGSYDFLADILKSRRPGS